MSATATRSSASCASACRAPPPLTRRQPGVEPTAKIKAPRGTFDVLGEQAARAALWRRVPARSSRGPGTSGSRRRRSRRPSCSLAASASRPTSCARRCSPSRTRPGARSRCAPRAPPRLPRLRRARHAQAPPAGEALVPVELLPPRARPGRALPAVLAGRRRGARLRGPGGRRRGDRAAGDAARSDGGARRCACACRASAASRAGASTASACSPTCAPTRRALRGRREPDRAQPAARVRLRTPRDAAGDGGGAAGCSST